MADPVTKWLRLDAGYLLDGKVQSVTAEAELLYVRALAMAKLLDSLDGRVELGGPRSTLHRGIRRSPDLLAEELTAAGLWITNGGTYGPPADVWRRWQTDATAAAKRQAAYRARQAAKQDQ